MSISWGDGDAACDLANTFHMTPVGDDLSPLLMPKVVRPHWRRDALGHTVQRMDVRAPKMDVDLAVFRCDDAGTCVIAVGRSTLPAVRPLGGLAEDGRVSRLFWLGRARPDRDDLNRRVAVVGCNGAG